MLTDKERELFSLILDTDAPIERNELLFQLETMMGSERFNKFMSMGKEMFKPREN